MNQLERWVLLAVYDLAGGKDGVRVEYASVVQRVGELTANGSSDEAYERERTRIVTRVRGERLKAN